MNNLPIAVGLSILLLLQYSAHGQMYEFSDVDMVNTFNDDFGYGSTEIAASPSSFMGRSAIQSDDKVISILNDGGSPTIVRFDQNGALDESFQTKTDD